MPTSIPEVDYPCVVVTKVGVDGSALADGGGWRTLGGVGDGGRESYEFESPNVTASSTGSTLLGPHSSCTTNGHRGPPGLQNSPRPLAIHITFEPTLVHVVLEIALVDCKATGLGPPMTAFP
jgi:hypothetical protein